MKTLTQKWFAIGESELDYAEFGLTREEFYSQVCVQAHQAVEKFLKADLIERGADAPKTHDLAFLCRECMKYEQRFSEFADDCDFLADFYIELRYPSFYPEKTKTDATRAVGIANKIHDFIFDLLSK